MESTALYDFSPENDGQLAFKKDETVLIVTPDRQDGWLLCEIRGRQGLAPKNYLSVLPNTWYKGKVPLAKIHSHLLSQPNDGAFIIHDSESTPGDFEISVKKNQNEVVSHKILRDGSWRFFLWVVKFNTINKLVDYHRAATIDRDGELYLKGKPSFINLSAPDSVSAKFYYPRTLFFWVINRRHNRKLYFYNCFEVNPGKPS